MSSCNCCFLTCIHISQEAGKVVCYSHLLKNFPQFVVIHTVKGFSIVNKTEVDIFLEFSCFSMIQWILAIWSLVLLPFLNPVWTSGRFTVHVLLKPGLENFGYYFAVMWDECSWALSILGIAFLRDWNENRPFPVLWPLLSSKFANILIAGLSQHHLLGFETTQLESLHLH